MIKKSAILSSFMEGILRTSQYIFVVLHGRHTADKSVQLCRPSWKGYCGQVSTTLSSFMERIQRTSQYNFVAFMEGIQRSSQYNFVVLHGRGTADKSVQLCGNFLLTTLEMGINMTITSVLYNECLRRRCVTKKCNAAQVELYNNR